MPEIRFRATEKEIRTIDGRAAVERLSRVEWIRAKLGLQPPRPVGAPAGNSNNPFGRLGRLGARLRKKSEGAQ